MAKTNSRIAAAIAVLAALLLGCALLAGCSGSNDSGAAAGSSASNGGAKSKGAIKIEQIEWTAEPGVVDGNRRYVFSCTNNSNYQIADLSMAWSIKGDVTADQFKETFARILESASDEDKEAITDSQIKSYSLSAETTYLLEPGATSEDDPITVGYLYLENEDEYNLFEPDIMTIKYVDGDKLITEYYDFKTGSYSTESEGEELYSWPDNDWAKAIPQPQGLVITEMEEDDAEFEFTAIGVTPKQAQAYFKECKDMGFTKVDREYESGFTATNADGTYKVDIDYLDFMDNSLEVTLTKL